MVAFKPQVEFPLIEEYKKVFAITPRTIFAYDDAIYANGPLSDDLLVHEMVHIRQQHQIGLDEWVKQYLASETFRLAMEIEAYQEQLRSITDRNERNRVRVDSARTLSGPLYGNIISYNKAIEALT